MPAKKAQRTKGNVKPSSSSQAAQLLTASGQAPTGFIGFSNSPAFVPVSEILEDTDSHLDGEFRLVLKKFSKRDTTTKIKALQEFCSLCNQKDFEAVKAVVPFWPRIYNKVAIDIDHKVRELSQKSLLVLASCAGKAIAPHLKSIMGTWMVSMMDSYPTVASAANTAFTTTFPGSKQEEAINFCKVEILEYLLTNIVKHTAKTLSDPLTTSEEDMESKYQQIVSSSLHALRKLMSSLQSEAVTRDMVNCLTDLLQSPAFWKHSKSTVPMIKGGVLNFLSTMCQRCQDVTSKFLTKISPFVFSCLDEKETAVMVYAWEAVLSMVNAHQDCWEHVSWQKAVWPKLKNVLAGGCCGQATILSPCLLLLLSKIPKPNFAQFFDAFRLGLNDDIMLNSPSNTSALVHSFIECIQYSIKSILASGLPGSAAEAKILLQDQVLVVIEASLTDHKASLHRTELYSSISRLVGAASGGDSGIESEFWSDLSLFVLSHMIMHFNSASVTQPEISVSEKKKLSNVREDYIIERVPWLVLGLVYHETALTFRKQRVRFATPGETCSKVISSFMGKQKQQLSVEAEKFINDVLVAACTLSSLPGEKGGTFFHMFQELSVMHIPAETPERLSKGWRDPASRKILDDLGIEEFQSAKSSENWLADDVRLKLTLSDSTANNSYRDFLCNHLLDLLLWPRGGGGDCGGQQSSQDVVLTFFAFLSYLDEDEGSDLLFVLLDSLTDPETTCQFIEQLLEFVKWVPACRRVVEGSTLGIRIEAFAMNIVCGEDALLDTPASSAVWRMLTSVLLSMDENDCHLFSQSCLDAVMSSCVATLTRLQDSDLSAGYNTVVSVVNLVQASLDKHKLSNYPQLEELLMNLSHLLLNKHIFDDEFAAAIERAWLTGLRCVVDENTVGECHHRMLALCNLLKGWTESRVTTLDELRRVSDIMQLLLQTLASTSESPTQRRDGGIRSADKKINFPEIMGISDHILIVDLPHVEGEIELLEYLYLLEFPRVLRPSALAYDPPITVNPQMFCLRSLHNLRTIKYLRTSMDAKELDASPPKWSETEMLCIAAAFHCLVLVKTILQLKPDSCVDAEAMELRDELSTCIQAFVLSDMTDFLDLAYQRSEDFPVFDFGLESIVVTLLKTQPERKEASVSVLETALKTVETRFLDRSVMLKGVVGEVKELLRTTSWCGHGCTEAFILSLSVAMSCEHICVESIGDCVLGFVHLAAGNHVLTDDVKVSYLQQLFDVMKQLKARDVHLLSGGDTRPSSASLHFNFCIARSLRMLAVTKSEPFWDFCLCALVEWIQFLSEIQVSRSSDVATRGLMVSVFEVAELAASTFSTAPVVTEASAQSPELSYVTEKAKSEWGEFFSDGVFSVLIPMFVSLASLDLTSTDRLWTRVLRPLAAAVSFCPSTLVLSHQLPAALTVTDTSGIPDSLKTLFNHLCPLLVARQRCIQVAVYRMLICTVEEIPKYEAVPEENKEEEEIRSPPEALVHQVELCSQFLDRLMVVAVDEQVEMEAGTEESSVARGYILAWRLLLQLFSTSPNLLRAKYAHYFKAHDSVNHLLDHLFRLMPLHPTPATLERDTHLDVTGEVSRVELAEWALLLYRQCLETLPALVRVWWTYQDRKSSNFIDRYTTQHLSNSLIWQQTTATQSSENNMAGITIRARPATREVCVMYEMTEVTINMSITLPENYPLGKLDVSCDKKVGVSQAQWDRWLLQLNIFLQHQNGSIVEGLRLWKGNIDKKFEGIEECMICFSVIHGTSFQLPRLTCKTCRKKFHSSCLYKWFSTSQKSSCPMCRNLF